MGETVGHWSVATVHGASEPVVARTVATLTPGRLRVPRGPASGFRTRLDPTELRRTPLEAVVDEEVRLAREAESFELRAAEARRRHAAVLALRSRVLDGTATVLDWDLRDRLGTVAGVEARVAALRGGGS